MADLQIGLLALSFVAQGESALYSARRLLAGALRLFSFRFSLFVPHVMAHHPRHPFSRISPSPYFPTSDTPSFILTNTAAPIASIAGKHSSTYRGSGVSSAVKNAVRTTM